MYSVPSRTTIHPTAGQCEKKKSSERPRRHGHLSGGRRRRGLPCTPREGISGVRSGQRIMNRKGSCYKSEKEWVEFGIAVGWLLVGLTLLREGKERCVAPGPPVSRQAPRRAAHPQPSSSCAS